MKLLFVLLLYQLAILCVPVQSDSNPKNDTDAVLLATLQNISQILVQSAAGDAVLLTTLQNIERILDHCPRGWMRFKSYCYLVKSSIKTWDQAQAHCQGLGGRLVKINSAEENEFVLNLVNKHAPSLKQVWIGLKWNPGVKEFLWYDHSVPIYNNWHPHEPNGKASEPCGHMFTGRAGLSGYWNDLICGVHHVFPCGLVCKRLVS